MRRGFLLVDALIGMMLLGMLLGGLHQLRAIQVRGVKSTRARLSATETAGALALLAALTPAGERDAAKQRELALRLRPADPAVKSAGALEITTFPLDAAHARVTARAPWVAGKYSGVEEVSAVAPLD